MMDFYGIIIGRKDMYLEDDDVRKKADTKRQFATGGLY
jgi:hypothetical protein